MTIATTARVMTLVVIALTMTGCQALIEPRSTMSVDDVVEAFTNQPGLTVTNPRDITAEACATDGGCAVAVRAEEITIYRFEDQEDAEKFTGHLGGDGYQSDWIVLEYPEAKLDTDSALLSYATTVDGMWASD